MDTRNMLEIKACQCFGKLRGHLLFWRALAIPDLPEAIKITMREHTKQIAHEFLAFPYDPIGPDFWPLTLHPAKETFLGDTEVCIHQNSRQSIMSGFYLGEANQSSSPITPPDPTSTCIVCR